MIRTNIPSTLALGLSLLLAFAVGCAKAPPPNANSGGAYLISRQPMSGQLDCPKKDCVHWFRADAPEKGTLTITVRDLDRGETPAGYRLMLADASMAAIANRMTNVALARTFPATTPSETSRTFARRDSFRILKK